MSRIKKNRSEIVPLLPSDGLFVSLEELEGRLENQIAALTNSIGDAHCLYYLCTTRCSGTESPSSLRVALWWSWEEKRTAP